MLGKEEDIRKTRTVKAVNTAMLTLLGSRNFKQITVSEICEEALISRGTFYTHFADKYDLLKEWLAWLRPVHEREDEIYEQTEERVNELMYKNATVIRNLIDNADEETLRIIFDFIVDVSDQIAHVQLSRFRKDIETLLGIRIAQVEVMTDAERDRLASQRKLMNKRRKTLEKIDEVVVQNDTLKGLLAKAKEKSVIDDIKKQIKDNEEIIVGQKKKVDEITAEIKKLDSKPEEKAKEAGKVQEKKQKK